MTPKMTNDDLQKMLHTMHHHEEFRKEVENAIEEMQERLDYEISDFHEEVVYEGYVNHLPTMARAFVYLCMMRGFDLAETIMLGDDDVCPNDASQQADSAHFAWAENTDVDEAEVKTWLVAPSMERMREIVEAEEADENGQS